MQNVFKVELVSRSLPFIVGYFISYFSMILAMRQTKGYESVCCWSLRIILTCSCWDLGQFYPVDRDHCWF